MIKSKRGSTVFVFLMIGVVFILMALALSPGLRTVTNESMSSAELNCSNSSISDQDQAVCTSLDIMPFLYMGVLLGLAGLILSSAVLR